MEKGIVMKNGNPIGILLEILETRNGNFLVSCLEYDREFPRFFTLKKCQLCWLNFIPPFVYSLN
jgi:hypothetical protein